MNRAFCPAALLPGGFGAEVWTFFTYALIHGSWVHYGVNAIWLLPFGSAMARRFGPWRFMAFFAVTAAAGAVAHLIAYVGQNAPVVGASAAISGTMAGAMRFAFQPGGPLNFLRTGEDADFRVPAIPLSGVLRDPRVLIFVGVWFGVNLLFGATSLPIGGPRRRRDRGVAGAYRRLRRRAVAVFLVRSGAHIAANRRFWCDAALAFATIRDKV